MPYASSQAYPGRGSSIYLSSDSGTTWTPIGEVKDINPSGAQSDQYDSSNFESGIFKEYVQGMIDNGEISVTLNHVPSDAGQAALRTNFESAAKLEWGILLPASSITTPTDTTPAYYTFSGFIKQLNLPKLGVEALAEASFSVKVSGAITETAEGTTASPFV